MRRRRRRGRERERPLFRRHPDHRPSTGLPAACLRVLRVFVSDFLPRLCAATSAHVSTWRVARRGRTAQRHGLGGQRDRTSFVGRPAARWRADLGQCRGSVRILCAFKLCHLWQRAFAPGISLVAALALGIGGLAPGATLCGRPARRPKPVRSAADHRAGAAGQQSRPVCRPGCAWPVGRASRLACRAGHPRACRTVRACLRIRASTYSRYRRTARAQRTTASCCGAPMVKIIE